MDVPQLPFLLHTLLASAGSLSFLGLSSPCTHILGKLGHFYSFENHLNVTSKSVSVALIFLLNKVFKYIKIRVICLPVFISLLIVWTKNPILVT